MPPGTHLEETPPPSRLEGLKAALAEAQFVAGGLVGRAAESTKHYTIIRHSHALVWYRGPGTSVCMTILADEPVPANRTVWLQARGYSGNAGMSLEALAGSRDKWIDVTPACEAQACQLPDAEERGIQRDMRRWFAREASSSPPSSPSSLSGRVGGEKSRRRRRRRRHVPRETHMVRIPASAGDGYFRLLLCGGDDDPRKTLCGSPVFRIASTSADMSVIRGASLGTMPLEMGLKVASTVVGTHVVRKYTGIAGAVVQSSAGRFAAAARRRQAAAVASEGAGGGAVQDAVRQSWRRGNRQQHEHARSATPPEQLDMAIIGADDGPEKPFPINFSGKVSRGTGRSGGAELGVLPTANLDDVPDHVRTSLGGVFAAWAMMMPAKAGATPDDDDDDWNPAVVTIAPPRGGAAHHPAVAMSNGVRVHIAADMETDTGTKLLGRRVKIMLMGYLRPATGAQEELLAQHARDVCVTLNSLGREKWCPPTATGARSSLGDRLDDAAGRVQQAVDRIPLHWAGVRSASALARDGVVGNGGLWVRR